METKTKLGFALIDTIIAIFLVGLAVFIFGIIIPGMNLASLSRSQVIAGSIAESKLDELRGTAFDSLAEQTNTPFSHPDLVKLFNSQASYSLAFFDANQDGSNETDIKEAFVTVTWSENGETKNKTYSTLISRTGLSR